MALEVAQLILLSISFFFWIAIIVDPVRRDIKVKLGPDVAGKAGARDIMQVRLHMFACTRRGPPGSENPCKGIASSKRAHFNATHTTSRTS